MLHELFVVGGEILAEIAHEIAVNPVRFVGEVVQFLLLVGIVWVVAMGVGKRRGFVANMLSERERRLSERLEIAARSDEGLAAARKVASLKIRTANSEARALLAEAKVEAEKTERQAKEDADAEAALTLSRAKTALENEIAEMHQEVREHLIDLVSQATRSIMNEKMSVAEQRQLIEATIIAGVNAASSGGNGRGRGGDASSRRVSKATQ